VDGSFELCNNWLCTSSDVEAGFNYPISKKCIHTGHGQQWHQKIVSIIEHFFVFEVREQFNLEILVPSK
jgi:hypothetical protein